MRGTSRAIVGADNLNVRPMKYDSPGFWALLVAFAGVTSYVGVSWIFSRRAIGILQNWAASNGFEVTRKRVRPFSFPGPFKGFASSPRQIICSFSIRDRGGCERSGWALCGSYLGGVFSEKIEIRWDETLTRSPNQSSEPTPASVTPPARQESRPR